MRKTFIILLFLATFTLLQGHEYTATSRLAQGKFVKISVRNSGVYKLTYNDLKNMGLQPENVRIFGFGGGLLEKDFRKAKIDDLPAVPFYMHKTNGEFGKSDYILFYAQGTLRWTYNGSNFVHANNHYSLDGYYFLSDDAGEQVLLENLTADSFSADAYEVTTCTKYDVFDKDSVNIIDRYGGGEGGGKEFYYPINIATPTLNLKFTFPDIISSRRLRCVLDVAASASVRTNFTCKQGSSSNVTYIGARNSSDHYEMAVTAHSSFDLTAAESSEQNITLTYNAAASNAAGYLNYLEVSAVCSLAMNGNSMLINNTDYYGDDINSIYRLSKARSNLQIWNISNLGNIYSVPTQLSGDILSFEAPNSSMQTLLAVDVSSTDYPTPTYVGTVENQNLHALQDIEYVIITPKQFVAQAEQLAKAHEQKDGLSWAVVTDEQVYNEFSSGTPDATAYRWLMKMLYDRADRNNGVAPRYLLLMGDGSYDNRGLNPASAPHTLLTYQADNSTNQVKAYSSDDYFGFLDDREGISDLTARMDIGVGRFPVNTVSEAQDVVNKTINYINNPSFGKWKTQLIFLADDGDSGLHTDIADYAAENIRLQAPDYITNKIYIDAYQQEVSASGESYPLAKTKFDNLINNGALFFDYSGHGGYNNITTENILTASEIRNMNNVNIGFWMLATCGFANFDAKKTSASEYAVLNPNGGALAVVSACRTVYATNNKIINRHVCDSLLLNTNNRLGDAVRLAKNKTGSEENKLAFILLGDPAVRLDYPNKYKVVTTSKLDTLKALSTQHLSGFVADADSNIVSTFNGKMQITVYDKLQVLKTLDNDQTDEEFKVRKEFNDYPNTIFSGEVDVVNGTFSADFIVPLDIRYNFGTGRIAYYAYDPQEGSEAIGHYHNLIVGGGSNGDFSDKQGPEISIYLNTPYFANGDRTDSAPHFYAQIADQSGINTSGSGIGHDLLLVIDNDLKQTYVLNDYFISLPNNFSAGTVSYPLSGLETGKHELTFRAWDLMNNSSSRTLQFEVVENLAMTVHRVVTYPNPVGKSETVYFTLDHDQPDKRLTMQVSIYDISGQLIATEERETVGTSMVEVNLAEKSISAGAYVYRIAVIADGQKTVYKAGKLIIVE